MQEVIDVQTGQVKVGRADVILKANALGSCVAVTAFDPENKIGAMAHVMLPGKAPDGKGQHECNRYAANAIDTILLKMNRLGASIENIKVALVGGANVLKRENDSIFLDNIISVLDLLEKKQLKINAQVLGGTQRRSVTLDIDNATIYYTEGDSGNMKLY
ncbi:MAG: chemotaxis protein CheD [Sedimentisphaerales bacterium]|nr:chemotaxis protein CheD [Sedimentisphaerales bacterium]